MSDSKNDDDRCVLCLDEKRFPVSIECGHSFCFGCLDIYKSYKKYPWANKCPICRDVLKEKKKPTKCKHFDQTTNAQNPPINFAPHSQNTSAASLASLATQHDNSVEEFMSLAANYFDDSRDEGDDFFYSYEFLDHSAQDSTQSGEYFSTPYSQANEDNSNELDFTGDFEDDDEYDIDNDGADNDDEDYDYDYDYDAYDNDGDAYYQSYYEDDEISYESPRTRGNLDEYYSDNFDHNDSEATSFLNVDDNTVTYENNFDIDWETVIASDIIIID